MGDEAENRKGQLDFQVLNSTSLYKRQSHFNMTLKEWEYINIAACQNHVTIHLMKGVWGISSQWGKTVLLVVVGCIPAEGQTLAGQSTKKGGILARKEKTIPCLGRGTDVSQIKQIKVKLMLCCHPIMAENLLVGHQYS